jgi:hypothetical protein
VYIVQIERKQDAGGKLQAIVLSWDDAQFFIAPKLLHDAVWAGTCIPVVGIPLGILYYLGFGVLWPLASSCLLLMVGAVLWCILRSTETQQNVRRECVLHRDGGMEFPRGLPEYGGPLAASGINALRFTGVEYSSTAQWTNLDPKIYNTVFRGGWFDVYGTLTDGRRFLLARNCWDRDTNHELAIALGTAIREMQALLKPSPAKAASPAAARARRVID